MPSSTPGKASAMRRAFSYVTGMRSRPPRRGADYTLAATVRPRLDGFEPQSVGCGRHPTTPLPENMEDPMAPPVEASRREFLKLAAATAAVATAAPSARAEDKPPVGCGKAASDAKRVGLATIGLGGQGNSDTKAALKVPGVELVAVADLYDGRLKRAREVYCDGLVTTRDYKEVLARPDVDAVIVATPDHWHSRIAIEAMNAGKDVYVEKPMVHSVEEGLEVVEAQRRTKRILQVGSQRTSNVVYHKAKELLAAGAIGELNMVEAWWNRNSAIRA